MFILAIFSIFFSVDILFVRRRIVKYSIFSGCVTVGVKEPNRHFFWGGRITDLRKEYYAKMRISRFSAMVAGSCQRAHGLNSSPSFLFSTLSSPLSLFFFLISFSLSPFLKPSLSSFFNWGNEKKEKEKKKTWLNCIKAQQQQQQNIVRLSHYSMHFRSMMPWQRIFVYISAPWEANS